MASLIDFASLVARQDTEEAAAPSCETGNDYDGRIGLRIAALFIIWVTSSIGAVFPVFAKRNAGLRVPEWVFFFCKFFGSGVIVATAFIHLLAPANEALTNECLNDTVLGYPWPEGIALMSIFVLFFVELMVMRYADFGGQSHSHGDEQHSQHNLATSTSSASYKDDPKVNPESTSAMPDAPRMSHQPGQDHLGHVHEHTDIEDAGSPLSFEDYKAQLTAVAILEFGIIFHSIFIGLTLAVSGSEFDTLFVVLIFHQTFEGLGLGARLALTPWPQERKWTPYILGLVYGLSTPLAIAVGLGVRNTYPPESATTLVVNGVFDSISAGILIYTGLVELMAHEFLFSRTMAKSSIRVLLSAFGLMAAGAALMALLGKWA